MRPDHLGATVCNHKRSIIPRYCKCCGEIIPFNANTKSARYKLRNFCSSSCAAKINNQRAHSEESKIKASQTALERCYGGSPEVYAACLEAKRIKNVNARSKNNSGKYYKDNLVYGQDYVICPYCNRRFSQIQSSHLKNVHSKSFADLYTDFGADYLITSTKTYNKKVEAGKKVQQRLIEAGVHKGWQSRNIASYAENFWLAVLDNNQIKYKQEVPVWHGSANYFLDFVIEKNGKAIDLQIDGKQHTYTDRANSDVVRDLYLTKQGYLVYRIPWNEIKTEQGKAEMQRKITEFLDFYNSL